jgi:glycosyltransferase involved in cell wall biosynthesis
MTTDDLPRISCVIPVYNGAAVLRRAVASVLAQGPHVELVLVDDGSRDASRELCAELARADRRVVAFPLPGNFGQGFARNIGVAIARARNVTFLDQDDEHLPGWYAEALEWLEAQPQLAGIKGEVELAEVPSGLEIGRDDPRWLPLVNSTIWNVVLRKAAYLALGGSPVSDALRTREGNEDITLMMALLEHFKVAKAGRAATRHYVKPGGATAYFLGRTRVVGESFEFLEQTETERGGELDRAQAEFKARAAQSLAALRRMLAP